MSQPYEPAPPQVKERKRGDNPKKVLTTLTLVGEEPRKWVEDLLARFPGTTLRYIGTQAMKEYHDFWCGGDDKIPPENPTSGSPNSSPADGKPASPPEEEKKGKALAPAGSSGAGRPSPAKQ